jgi:FkbH-like protein
MKDQIKQHFKEEQYLEALSLILSVQSTDPIDLIEYSSRQLLKIPRSVIEARKPTRKKLAMLGGATTTYLLPLVRLFALKRGLDLEIYESPFGLYEQEVYASSEVLRAFAPDVIHFHVVGQNLAFPLIAHDPKRRVQVELDRWLSLCRQAAQRFSCSVVLDNFATESARAFGNLDVSTAGTRNSMIRALNAAIADGLPPQTVLHDVEQLSAEHGKSQWFDPRLWNSAKVAVSFECLPHYAGSLASILGALFGKSKKCLVFDLDNTLWGGVIGDDGLQGIRLSPDQPDGESFQRFQEYARALKERGVLLAVATKNELENALSPFREHDNMILKESDLACVVASWDPKDGSLAHIAQRLNIGLDSLVFFDDNPAERQLVRDALPDVLVVDVPEDPSLYVQALDRLSVFETVAITREDQERTALLQQGHAREAFGAKAGSYDDFLRSLAMVAVVEPVNEQNIVRVTQLINKTNQFNLTTRRMTEAEVRAAMKNPDVYTSTIRLDDRFGSNGLISVVLGTVNGDTLTLDNWLMSCRVLKRGVEVLDMERVLAFCRVRGLRRVIGNYMPTTKNKLVENHYAELGFARIDAGPERGVYEFELEVHAIGRVHFISVASATKSLAPTRTANVPEESDP